MFFGRGIATIALSSATVSTLHRKRPCYWFLGYLYCRDHAIGGGKERVSMCLARVIRTADPEIHCGCGCARLDIVRGCIRRDTNKMQLVCVRDLVPAKYGLLWQGHMVSRVFAHLEHLKQEKSACICIMCEGLLKTTRWMQIAIKVCYTLLRIIAAATTYGFDCLMQSMDKR
ncbi:hypothetical protein BKA63DRAFT_63025 [Paraphoma chrysanthemicola]|nr:hypothetical protein BKA63DRAFT_63025 [Paraphoma chrysanthemicola]